MAPTGRSRYPSVVVTGAVLLAIVACTQAPPEDAPTALPEAWRAEITTLLAGDVSDFEREVLSDHVITDAELSAARDEFRRCVEEKDDRFEVVFGQDGSTEVGAKDSAQVSMTQDEQVAYHDELMGCGRGTTDNVFYVYYGARLDPQKRSYPELVRACFEQEGVADGSDLSDEDFQRMIFPDDGTLYTPRTAEGQACMDDPHGVLGLAPSAGG